MASKTIVYTNSTIWAKLLQLVPGIGIELMTFALQVRCSAC